MVARDRENTQTKHTVTSCRRENGSPISFALRRMRAGEKLNMCSIRDFKRKADVRVLDYIRDLQDMSHLL